MDFPFFLSDLGPAKSLEANRNALPPAAATVGVGKWKAADVAEVAALLELLVSTEGKEKAIPGAATIWTVVECRVNEQRAIEGESQLSSFSSLAFYLQSGSWADSLAVGPKKTSGATARNSASVPRK